MTASGRGVPLVMMRAKNKARCRSMETMHSVISVVSIGILGNIKKKLPEQNINSNILVHWSLPKLWKRVTMMSVELII